MHIIKNIILFSLLITSINLTSQSVTFQSYMETVPWAEQVLLNGNPLTETSSGVFEIPPSDVLSGKNIIEINSLNPSGGNVTALDIVLIRKAIAEVVPLDASSIILADIDDSNFVGIADLIVLQKKILGIDPVGFEYKFLHSEFDLNSLDLFDFGDDIYKFCFYQSELSSTNFIFNVGLSGDVNQSSMLMPNNNPNPEVRSDNLNFTIDNINLISGTSFEIPFSFSHDDKIEALQLQLKNKGILIESIELDSYDHEIQINNALEDQTRMILLSEFPSNKINGTIKGTSYINAKSSDIISISSDFHDEVVYSHLGLSGVSIEHGTTSIEEDITLNSLVVAPNPVQDYVSIQIPASLHDASTITLTNIYGQVVFKEQFSSNIFSINRSQIGASGLYVLTWSYGNNSVHKKLILE